MKEMTFDEAIEALKHAVYGEEVRYAIARALVLSMNTQQSVAGKENSSNKKTTLTGNESRNDFYPSTKAVADALSGKENSSNKKTTLTGNESSNNFYPTTKAVADALSTKAPASTAYTFDSTTTNVVYDANNPKKIYLNAHVNSKDALVLTTSNNYYQIAFCYDGTEYTRQLTSGGSTTYKPWALVNNENTGNKISAITASNKTSTEFYPSIKAVVDYLAANYLGSGDNTVSWANLASAVRTLINGKENTSNKLTSQTGIDSTSTDAQYPTGKAVYDLGVEILALVNDDISNVESRLVLKESFSNKKNAIAGNETSEQFYPSTKAVADALSGKENSSNKKTTLTGNESSNNFYPTTKAVADALSTKAPASTAYTFDSTTTNVVYDANNPKKIYLNATVNGENGIVITAKNNDFQYFLGRRGTLKIRFFTGGTSYSDWTQVTEHVGNKISAITASNKTSTDYYPSIKAVCDYGSQISSAVEDVKAYIGYTSGDILGLHADFENKVFTRLGAAVGLTAGQDFNAFPMYGQRRRVVVDSNGVIIDGYSPEDVGESDTDVDVMVYQPKFYYKVVPLKLEKQSSGLGYHIRKANYYISSTPHAGFKLHPLFFDKNGNEIDYVLFSAYEASYLWRRQVDTNRYVDRIFHDGVDTDTTIETSAVLKSLPGVKPISGQYKEMNKVNMESCALRKSSNWHLDTIQSVAANQLLIAIEYGTFNTQSAIGLGIVNNPDSDTINCSSLTGSTSAETFNMASGMASETIYDVVGTEIPFNTNGKVAVSYRGMENPWGNIWKHVNGINIWGDGTMNGGQAYICSDFNFYENKHSGNYKSIGFSIANANNYISAFGYGKEEYDWLFLPSEVLGNNTLPVGDKCYVTANLNGNKIALHGAAWYSGDASGDYNYSCANNVGLVSNAVGGRLLYVPTATV